MSDDTRAQNQSKSLAEQPERRRRTANDYLNDLDDTEKDAAGAALTTLLDRHVEQLVKISRETEVKSADLVASAIRNVPINEAVRADLASLHQKVRQIVLRAATEIENNHYENSEQALREMDLTRLERSQAEAVLAADKKMAISCRTMHVCMELFQSFNNALLNRLDAAVSEGRVREEKTLLFTSAVMAYEVADFLANFIEGFEVQGLAEFARLHADVQNKTQDIRNHIAELKSDAGGERIKPGERDRIMGSVNRYESAVEAIDVAWKALMGEIETVRSHTLTIKDEIATLRLRRKEAKVQLMLLEVMQIVSILRDNRSTIQAAISALSNFDIRPLNDTSVRRLLGIV